jgi:hypothetical protein
MWSVAVLDPAFPGRSSTANGSPDPDGPWSTNAHNGWNPNPRLNVGAACSFSEWAVTSVASMSMASGCSALIHRSGACSPAKDHTRARAAALAAWIAFNTLAASAASAVIVRDTVGSEATGPNTAGSARSTATSAKQSPPRARVTARSVSTFAGSWTAVGFRHGARACDRALSRPLTRIASVTSNPPAEDTTPAPAAPTCTRG